MALVYTVTLILLVHVCLGDVLKFKPLWLKDPTFCDPREFVSNHEPNMPCMYLTNSGSRRIGRGFDLDDPEAELIFDSIGGLYVHTLQGKSTKIGDKCDCDQVACINSTQIEELFVISIVKSIDVANVVFSNFEELCCDVKSAVVDMSLSMGQDLLQQYVEFDTYVSGKNWDSASDFISLSKFCFDDETSKRCHDDASMLRKGCPCSSKEQKCNNHNACCGAKDVATCCEADVYFHGVQAKNISESWCCGLKDGLCCPSPNKNACCSSGFPNCCHDQGGVYSCCSDKWHICCPRQFRFCCNDEYPICGNGGCKKKTGEMIQGLALPTNGLMDVKP